MGSKSKSVSLNLQSSEFVIQNMMHIQAVLSQEHTQARAKCD